MVEISSYGPHFEPDSSLGEGFKCKNTDHKAPAGCRVKLFNTVPAMSEPQVKPVENYIPNGWQEMIQLHSELNVILSNLLFTPHCNAELIEIHFPAILRDRLYRKWFTTFLLNIDNQEYDMFLTTVPEWEQISISPESLLGAKMEQNRYSPTPKELNLYQF